MKEPRQTVNKARKRTDGRARKSNPEELTCNEGQVEDFLSAGESTEAVKKKKRGAVRQKP